ncbi:glycosyltransferase family 4 protein [Nocardioides sp.]|uniref:glycosyltransferase family 4 protein n=1 Tax=Nocardioides sp. TaxID=35761 RepID=UPI002B614124|nr:glycosyltransferase family 4 protein [Nocardioides sp.]HXH80908.1 glycosyltransferase family 4 protein [Nocardioides sp.]
MSSSKTIWYVSKYVAPPQGESVGGRGYELMRELAALGHTCVIVTSDANHLAETPTLTEPVLVQQRDGLSVHWLRTFKAATAKSWQRIVSWLHFEWRLSRLDTSKLPAPDAVIVSSLSLLTVVNGLVLKRRHRTRLVFEVRDIWPLTLVEEGGFTPANPLVRALGMVERLGYRRADVIVGTMPALGKHVREVLGEEREVHCIPMGFSGRAIPDEPAPEPPAARSAGGPMVVGYAGTVGITNALESFLEAARSLRDEPGIRFVVIGDGPLLASFKEQYADVGSVSFVPKVPKDRVAAELDTCDLLYLSTYPSKVWEFGQSLNKLIDYMMSGRPILASFSGHHSMINEADCGSFVPAGDTDAVVAELRRYAAMPPEERAAIGARGRTWLLEHRSYERLARDYHEILFPGTSLPGVGVEHSSSA